MNAKGSNIFISVIIPSGRPHQARHTISCLLRQTLPSSQYEIIVVTPAPELIAKPLKPAVRVVDADHLYPPGKMRNLGAKAAAGGYLFFIDDDCLPPPQWLFRMLEALEQDKKNGAVGCRVVSPEINFWNRCADYALFGAYQYNRLEERDIGSAAIVVRRLAFEEAGGFDETLYASEDWDFNFRLAHRGWKRVFNPLVEVAHNHGRGTLSAILNQAYASGFQSGLVVQELHIGETSLLAHLSVKMKSPWFYWSLIFPYALIVSLFQVIEQKKTGPNFFFFIPLIFMAKCSYHFGVWCRLFQDRLAI